MTCVDNLDKIVTQSDATDVQGKSFVMLVRRCQGHSHCKSEEEIDEFIR